MHFLRASFRQNVDVRGWLPATSLVFGSHAWEHAFGIVGKLGLSSLSGLRVRFVFTALCGE